MRIEMSQTNVTAQFYYSGASQPAATQQAAPRAEHREHHGHHRVNRDDQVSLSSQVRDLQRVKHDHHGDDDPMKALEKLTGKLVESMMKAFTGRDFKMIRPDQVGGQQQVPVTTTGTPATVPSGNTQQPTTTPAPSGGSDPTTTPVGTPAANPYGNALATYYQVQSFSMSFSASGTVNTEDGQQLGISVQFSFSQQTYAALAMAGGTPAADSGTDTPVNANFQGIAAQLTQTSFNFELDFGGQPTPASPAPAEDDVATGTETATTAPGTTPVAANPVGADEAENPFLEELDKLFEKLRVWMHQADGTRQLIAYGLNSSTAVFLGTSNATEPAGSATTPAADPPAEQTPALDAVA